MRDRKRQRLNRKIKMMRLSQRDECGVYDPTPHEAVNLYIKELQQEVNQLRREKSNRSHKSKQNRKGTTSPPADS